MTKGKFTSKSVTAATAIFFVCMTVSIAVSLSLFHSERKNHRMMEQSALGSASSIVSELASSVYDPLSSIGAVVSAEYAYGRKNRTEIYHRFIETKNLLKKFPSVIAWSYAEILNPEIQAQQIANIDGEDLRAKLGYGKLKIFPEPEPGEPIAATIMVVPEAIAKKVVGYNVLSHDLRREVAERAVKTGKIQISKPVLLRTNVPGSIMFSPVYKTASTPATLEERQKNLIGFMMLVYATDSLFASVKDKFRALGLDVDVHDYGSIDADQRPYLSAATLIASNRSGLLDAFDNYDELIKVSKTSANYNDINVAGRTWRIVVRPHATLTNAFYSRHSLSIVFLIAGSLLSILSAVQVYSQLSVRSLLAEKVAAKTRALTDVQKELEKSRDRAERLSLTDSLTGLANRRALIFSFEELLASTARETHIISIAIMDIDYFKSINDTYGHDVGDAILTAFADIALSQLDERETVCFARLGGDEFAIVFCHPKGRRGISAQTTQKLLRCASQAGNTQLIPSVTASIGTAELQAKDFNLSTLMRKADVALYEAKRKGRARAVKYSQAIDDRTKRKDAIINATMAGLENDEFIPAFHPYVCLRRKKIIGFEVLARWQHKSRGLLTPAAFWDALCDETIATQISLMVMKKAFKKAGELKEKGYKLGRLGINVTTLMLENRAFANSFVDHAISCGLTAKDLKVEVTERILLSRNTERINKTLEQLSSHGVQIAFDDFGTGYASLTHLRNFPIDCVKIDKSFVREMEFDSKSRAIVSGIIKMAKDLHFIVIAEGTETETQAEILRELGCDAGQGFLYGKPIDASQVTELLETHRSLAA